VKVLLAEGRAVRWMCDVSKPSGLVEIRLIPCSALVANRASLGFWSALMERRYSFSQLQPPLSLFGQLQIGIPREKYSSWVDTKRPFQRHT
jgi:hypothetical protein